MKGQDMLKMSLVVMFFTTLANVFGYLFHLSMGMFLAPADYGLLFSLLSLWNILNLIAGSFSLVVAKYSAAFLAKEKNQALFSLMKTGTEKSILAGVGMFLILILLSPLIGWFLHISETAYLLLFAFSAFTIFPVRFFTGMLQGLERFFGFGLTNAFSVFTKLVLAITLVYLGFGIIGGLIGLVISGFVGFAIGFWFLKDIKRIGEFSITKLNSYPLLVLSSVIISGILLNIDVILARHFLQAYQAGIYSMIAVLGRIIIYAPVGIGIVLFPKVASAHERGEKTAGKLIKALVAVILISGSITLIYLIFPVQIISLLFGELYLPAAEHLALYGAAMLFLSIIGIIYNYELSKERGGILGLLAFVVVLQIVLISVFHNSINEIVLAVLISNIAGVVLFGASKAKDLILK